MSLETANYIGNLVSSNPTGADPKSRGDDHLRLIKSVLQNCFAGLTGAVMVGGVNGGAANAYTLTPTPPVPSLVDNMQIVFSPVVPNTGACTMNVSGLGIINLLSVSGQPLVSNDLVIGQRYRATYDGTAFRLNAITKNYADQLAFSSALPAQSLGFLRSTGTVASFGVDFAGFAANEVKGADIASAATINLTTATGNFLHITGSVGITAITIPAGASRTLITDAALTITAGASLLLPGGATSITTAPGDRLVVRGDTGGVANIIGHFPGNASANDLKAGTNATKPATAASLLSAQGFTALFQSAQQTITNAAGLTIAHGLGRKPISLQAFIINLTAELGYSVGDEVPVNPAAAGGAAAALKGVSLRADTTNILVRFSDGGGSANTFFITNATTGSTTAITNANWAFIVRAWA